MAPEIIDKKRHHFELAKDELHAADIWNFGKDQFPLDSFVFLCISYVYIWFSDDFRGYWKNICRKLPSNFI